MNTDDSAEACRSLIHRAASLTDQHRWPELANLFDEEGVLIRPSDPGNPIIGRPSILASLQARTRMVTRHIVSNILVERAKESAHVSSIALLCIGNQDLSKMPQPLEKILVGNFEDDLKWNGSGWQFVKRSGSMALELSPKQFLQLHG